VYIYLFFVGLCVLWMFVIFECEYGTFFSGLSLFVEQVKVNRLLSRSGYKSCLDVGSVAGVLELPCGASLFDVDGAEVTTQGNRLAFVGNRLQGKRLMFDNRLQVKDGISVVHYKVGLPNGASVRRTKRGSISLKRSGTVYTIKRSGYKCARMFSLVVYSLDRSLRWYLDGAEIEFPKDGNVSLVTAPVGHMVRLFGYDSENRLCDGVIIRVV
jgi:hypothetical protein